MNKISKVIATVSIASLGMMIVNTPTHEVEAAVFSKCAEAWQAGYSDIREDEYGYSKNLDHDHDGVACELENDTEGLFRPRVEQPAEPVVSEPQSTEEQKNETQPTESQSTESQPTTKEETKSTDETPVTTQKTLPQTSAVK